MRLNIRLLRGPLVLLSGLIGLAACVEDRDAVDRDQAESAAIASPRPSAEAPAAALPTPKAYPVPVQVVARSSWSQQVHEVKLSNGLTVLLRENHIAPAVTWMVFYRVGSRNEGPGETGAAHLLEHMLFNGTKRFVKGQIAQLLQRNGAQFSATTGLDYTSYFETYPSDRLELGLLVEADRMRNSLLLDSERRSEMTLVQNELARAENEPDNNLSVAVRAAAFSAHPYHHPVLGYRSDVEGISTQTLRSFYNAYYQPNNAVAVLTGDFHTDHAVRLIQRYFQPVYAGPKPPLVYTQEEPQIGERRVMLKRRGNTNLVDIAYHVPPASASESAALTLLQFVLWNGPGGTSGRLYHALVDSGLATRIQVMAEKLEDPGLFWLGASLRPGVAHGKVEQLLSEQVAALGTERVEADDLQRAKNQALTGQLQAQDSNLGLASELGEWAMRSRWQQACELTDAIAAVTPSDLQAVAHRYLVPENSTVGWYMADTNGFAAPPPSSSAEGAPAAQAAAAPHHSDEKPLEPGCEFHTSLEHFQVDQRLCEPQGKPTRRYPTQPWEEHPGTLRSPSGLTKAELPNGLVVTVLESHSNPSVAIAGWVKAGRLYDAAISGRHGTADLVAEMLSLGTATRSKDQLAQSLESVGASLGFGAGLEQTTFHATAVNSDWDLVAEILLEELQAPRFPATELTSTAKLLADRWRQADDLPAARANRLLWQQIYPDPHPYHPLAPMQAIKDLEQLRVQDLKAFHDRLYGPNNTAVVVVGDVFPKDVIAKLTQLTANWRRVQPYRLPPMAWPQCPRADEPDRIGFGKPLVETMTGSSNVEIRVGEASRLKKTDQRYYAAAVMNYILDGAEASLDVGKLEGPLVACLTVTPAQVEPTTKALRSELGRFLKVGPTFDEVKDAARGIIGSQAVSMSSNAGVASALAEAWYYTQDTGADLARYWANFAAQIDGVTPARARQAAIELIHPDSEFEVIVGPYEASAVGR